jgi:ribosomal protein S18 acetylase RimI-like enzyme
VEVRSLGYRTDLAILALEGSQVADRGDHLVIRTPGNPDYWWGNFLLLRELKPGSGGGWVARFAVEFPDARHLALGVDEADDRAVDAGEFPGMTMARNAVMTATSLQAPPRPNTEATFRTLEGDTDWRQSLELTAAIYPGEPGSDTGFLAAQLAAKRALTEAGHGAWLGAFLDGTLVSQLGLVSTEPGLGRYQSVETHPDARRRGLAGTLVWQAGATALAGGTRTLVMVAEPEEAAISVYRSVGFTVTESQLSFIHRPAQSLPARAAGTSTAIWSKSTPICSGLSHQNAVEVEGAAETRAPARWVGRAGSLCGPRVTAGCGLHSDGGGAIAGLAVAVVHVVHDGGEGAGGVPGEPGQRVGEVVPGAAEQPVGAWDLGGQVRGGAWVSHTCVHDRPPWCRMDGPGPRRCSCTAAVRSAEKPGRWDDCIELRCESNIDTR